MATIVTRAGKGAPLTHTEVDANFTNLNTDKIQSGDTVASLDINGGTIDGTVIGGSTPAAISGTTITGTSFVTTGNMTFGDNDKAIFGAGSDLEIYHDGGNSYISDVGTGSLRLQGVDLQAESTNGDVYFTCISNGAVSVRYDNATKLSTTSAGIDVTGTVTADGLTVDGDGLAYSATNIEMRGDANVRVTLGTAGTAGANNNSNWIYGNGTNLRFNNAGGFYSWETVGTERMRITSTGNVGIGTDSPATALEVSNSGGAILRLTSSDFTIASAGERIGRVEMYSSDGSNAGTGVAAYIEAISQAAFTGQGRPTHLAFGTSGGGDPTERMRITDTGSVGIGVSSPSGRLHVASTDIDLYLTASRGTNNTYSIRSSGANAEYLEFADVTAGDRLSLHGDDLHAWYIAGTERARIDASGNLLVGTTSVGVAGSSSNSGIQLHPNGSVNAAVNGSPVGYFNRQTSDGDIVQFRKDGTTAGSIGTEGGNLYMDGSAATGKTGIEFSGSAWFPRDNGVNSNGAVDLGDGSNRFKDLYLSGGVNAATLNVDGGTIKLDGNYPVGTANVALGDQALSNGSFSGNYNVAIGRQSMIANTSGSNNVAVGSNTLDANTTGTYNTAIGDFALTTSTTGTANTAIGAAALRQSTTASNNTAVGYQALYTNTTGSENTALGFQALDANTEGNNNIGIGYAALGANTTGALNVAIGSNNGALSSNTTGARNTAVGSDALRSNTTASNNTAVGYQAALNNTADGNTAVGYTALSTNSSGNAHVAVGYQALQSNTTGTNNTAVGWNALTSNQTGEANTAVGSSALISSTGSSNTAVGQGSLQANTSGYNNVAVGRDALAVNTTGYGVVAVGYAALSSDVTADESVAVGYEALKNQTDGRNHAFGFRAGLDLSTGNFNTLVGGECGENLTTGIGNTFVGMHAGRLMTIGGQCTAVGYQALYSQTTAAEGTAVGYQALYNTTGVSNTAVGRFAGQALTTGNQCIFFGEASGLNLTTGVRGMYIGKNTSASSGSVNYEMLISTNNASGKGASTGFINPNGGGVYQGNNSSSWSTTSDRRLKKNITDSTVGLAEINLLQVRNFEYRTENEITELNPNTVVKKSGVQVGVIAQEIQQVLPDCVKEESTGVLSVDPDNITWHLVRAIQELTAKVEALEAQLNP